MIDFTKVYTKHLSRQVRCSNCEKWFDETDVEFIDIWSDVYGYDNEKFICPECNTEQESLVTAK